MKTHEILKMTTNEYEILVMDWWLTYCQTKSNGNAVFLQKMLINNPLYSWWRSKLFLVEKEFNEDAIPFHHSYKPVDAKKLYAKHAFKLQLYYSNPLIEAAIK